MSSLIYHILGVAHEATFLFCHYIQADRLMIW